MLYSTNKYLDHLRTDFRLKTASISLRTIANCIGIHRLALMLVLCFVGMQSWGLDAVKIVPGEDRWALGPHFEFLEDPDRKLNLENVLALGDRFRPNTDEVMNIGYTHSGYWVRFRLQNDDLKQHQYFLKYGSRFVDHLDLYIPAANGTYQPLRSGRWVPPSQRPHLSREFVFPITLPPQSDQIYYLYMDTADTLTIPLELHTADSLAYATMISHNWFAFYFGLIFAIMVFSLFLLATVRDQVYLYYVTAITLHHGFFFSLFDGFGYLYFGFEDSWWSRESMSVFVCYTMLIIIQFCRVLLNTRSHQPFSDRLLVVLQIFAFVMGVFSFFIDYTLSIRIANPIASATAVVVFSAGYLSYRQGNSAARYFLLAWISVIIGGAGYSLKSWGLAPSNIFTEYGWQVGSALEALLLSLAIAERINIEKRERENAQRHAQQVQFEMFKEKTAQKEKVLEAEATMRAKDDFLSTMSHEIRTPMNGVVGVLQLLEDTPLDANQKELLRIMGGSAQTLLSIINDILDFSKIQAGKMQIEKVAFDLHQLLKDIADLYAMTTKLNDAVEFRFSIAPGTPQYVLGDPMRIKQILTNYLNNAVKFTQKGTISLIAEPAGEALVRLSVKDSGIGISEEGLNKLFQSYSQMDTDTARKYGGTGLGLSICKKLSELMGGSVGVSSKIGNGSTFWCTISLPPATDAEQKSASVCPTESSCESLRVLVAEDNSVNQFVVKNMLRKLGIRQVKFAENGKDALDLLATEAFDVVLMDCNMPVMDGLEATRLIRERELQNQSKRIPIAALTASATPEEQAQCLAAGMDIHICKPLILSDLATALYELYERDQLRPSPSHK